jgi:hypothetical protein
MNCVFVLRLCLVHERSEDNNYTRDGRANCDVRNVYDYCAWGVRLIFIVRIMQDLKKHHESSDEVTSVNEALMN